MNSIQQQYDHALSKMVCVFDYQPLETKEFVWTFHCLHTDNNILQNRPTTDGIDKVTVYDIRTKQWITLKSSGITNVRYPTYAATCQDHECCLTEETMFCDPANGEMIKVPKVMGRRNDMSPGEWLSKNCPEDVVCCDDLNTANDKYIQDIMETTTRKFGDDLSKVNAWKLSFQPGPMDMHWLPIMEVLYDGAEEDLANESLNIVKCRESWRKVIDMKGQEAEGFLQQEKKTLTEELQALKIVKDLQFPLTLETVKDTISKHPEIMEYLDESLDTATDQKILEEANLMTLDKVTEQYDNTQEEVEEINVIIDLLHEQMDEYKEHTSSCNSLHELLATWPPLLLPAPFKNVDAE